VLVARDGHILLNKGYGDADRERKIPNTAQTKFRIGSMTKEFTAMAILILQDRGQLDVHDRVCDYFLDCPSAWENITIHHLLTHTSGIPDYYSASDWEILPTAPMTPSDIIAHFRDGPLNFPPGEGWDYSNSGYILLGSIIERVSGITYEVFLEENIFSPLGMTNSGYLADLEGLALGYAYGDAVTPSAEDVSGLYSSGGLYSTVGDLSRWEKALSTDVLIPDSLRKVMFTPYSATSFTNEYKYGYGWLVGTTANHQMVGNMGRVEGFTSLNNYFLEDKVTVIVLCNQRDIVVYSIGVQLAHIAFQ
jgi:CubicO group peptidase (beta-lactamase class C family)